MKSILVDPRLERTLLQTKSNSCTRKGKGKEKEKKEGKKVKRRPFPLGGGRFTFVQLGRT